MVLERFAGMQNIYVADENDAIVAAALAVPVTLQGRTGNYLCLCGEGSLLLAGLLDTLCAHQKLRGAGFTVTVPADAAQAALLQDKGFAKAFALRCLPREVSRNLWSQAEFDTVTAKKLCELREQFWKDTVQLSPERMAVVLQELYARGATIVSNEHGYGIYFRKEERPCRRDPDGSRPREGSHRGKGSHHGRCCPAAVSGRGHPAGIRHDPL